MKKIASEINSESRVTAFGAFDGTTIDADFDGDFHYHVPTSEYLVVFMGQQAF